MKLILILLPLLISCFSLAESRYPELPNYIITKKEASSSVPKSKAKITFQISANHAHSNTSVIFADNGKQLTQNLNDKHSFSYKTKKGKHVFEFFLDQNFHEIKTDSIQLLGGYYYEITINFKSSTQQINVRKPVIYLYPELTTEISVEVDAKGPLSFSYPTYNNGWKVTAGPNGKIQYDGQQYRYLFWESTQEFNSDVIDTHYGYFVTSDSLTTFLCRQLSHYGFNSEEQADFITYWVPQMIDKKNLYIYFLVDDKCSLFADLTIKPEPTETGRFYMIWSEVPSDPNTFVQPVQQVIPVMDRKGFHVLEWGGAEVQNLLFDLAQ